MFIEIRIPTWKFGTHICWQNEQFGENFETAEGLTKKKEFAERRTERDFLERNSLLKLQMWMNLANENCTKWCLELGSFCAESLEKNDSI